MKRLPEVCQKHWRIWNDLLNFPFQTTIREGYSRPSCTGSNVCFAELVFWANAYREHSESGLWSVSPCRSSLLQEVILSFLGGRMMWSSSKLPVPQRLINRLYLYVVSQGSSPGFWRHGAWMHRALWCQRRSITECAQIIAQPVIKHQSHLNQS